MNQSNGNAETHMLRSHTPVRFFHAKRYTYRWHTNRTNLSEVLLLLHVTHWVPYKQWYHKQARRATWGISIRSNTLQALSTLSLNNFFYDTAPQRAVGSAKFINAPKGHMAMQPRLHSKYNRLSQSKMNKRPSYYQNTLKKQVYQWQSIESNTTPPKTSLPCSAYGWHL